MSDTESSVSKRYMMIGASCLVFSAALWWLSKDDPEEVKQDPTFIPLEKLREIIHNIFL